MITLEAEKLSFSYNGKTMALKDVSFRVKEKRIGIVGQNGSGKTTLLSIFMGFLKPESGKVTLNGVVPYRERGEILKAFAPSFEKGRLPYRMKVRDLVSLVGEITGESKEVVSLAQDLGVQSFYDKRVYELSSGQEQLLWIFNALSDPGRIPVLDEPFVHLDIHAYRRVVKVLKERFDSYILTSHVPEDVELLTESVIVLEKGEVRWYGKIPELEGAYEVFVASTEKVDIPNVVADFGNVLVCDCDLGLLESLMRRGAIRGYKKAGVRLLYAKIRD
ncbi:ABC transporter ATP-binding protein [Thermococcus waiotapuensis]|uniref:ABC transporter ATP-binding protein n=1 Tax=Thermococcus waiotapuensis TaxID=90909 RepID=A0AAE4T211_9EURY|nr:ABC transporter ATP-binding protein [Thermococcus waiotapuensis]MDV3104825.1 ABC transporter ATP-binding protein [Thermococcus waiotapuensis]